MKNENNSVTVTENDGIPMQHVNLDQPLPDLSLATEFPFDLSGEYWTPEKIGENRRMFFQRTTMSIVKDEKTGSDVELECAFFLWQADGGVKTVRNGSKRLVGLIQAYEIKQGTPLSITYTGKKKNSTNALMSDQWSVKPLIIDMQQAK